MPETNTPKTKKNPKWTKIQVLALWFLVAIQLSFWAGVVGGQYVLQQSHDKIEQVKTEAVAEYQASLKK